MFEHLLEVNILTSITYGAVSPRNKKMYATKSRGFFMLNYTESTCAENNYKRCN